MNDRSQRALARGLRREEAPSQVQHQEVDTDVIAHDLDDNFEEREDIPQERENELQVAGSNRFRNFGLTCLMSRHLVWLIWSWKARKCLFRIINV